MYPWKYINFHLIEYLNDFQRVIQYFVFHTLTICPPLRKEPPISTVAFLGILCLSIEQVMKIPFFIY